MGDQRDFDNMLWARNDEAWEKTVKCFDPAPLVTPWNPLPQKHAESSQL
jgi:hypothetical protein